MSDIEIDELQITDDEQGLPPFDPENDTFLSLSEQGSDPVNHITVPVSQPKNEALMRGLRKQMVQSFVQYLKDNAPSKVNPDLTLTFEPLSFVEIDRLANVFLDKGSEEPTP